MLPNEQHPQQGADVSRPDTINPLRDCHLEPNLDWLEQNYGLLSEGEKVLAVLVLQLWQHIQRLDGAWRIQQDRLIDLEERLKEVEWWQGRQDSYSLEQSEYNED